jgi:hypothetical protein
MKYRARRSASGEVCARPVAAGGRGFYYSPPRTRQWKPWNDLREPLELFVSPTLKEAAKLPARLKTTPEYLHEF